MRNPVWIINSTLAFFIFASVVYIIISFSITFNYKVMKNNFIKQASQKHIIDKSFLKTIYQDNDLFNTYVEQAPQQPVPVTTLVQAPPAPPKAEFMQKTTAASINFLEPLNINITGIIMSTNDFDSRIIIQDKSTKNEMLYKIGDKIEDSNILRILHDKVVFLRSNGQQDTLYTTSQDSIEGFNKISSSDWSSIVKQIGNNQFTINKSRFTDKISSLGEFISLMDFITEFENGESIGIRIGSAQDNILLKSLGLEKDDVIINIDDVKPINTNNRLEIFNNISLKNNGDIINIDILRNGNSIKIKYALEDLKLEEKRLDISNQIKDLPGNESVDNILDTDLRKEKFNPITRSIKKNDRQAMIKNGKNNKSILNDITN